MQLWRVLVIASLMACSAKHAPPPVAPEPPRESLKPAPRHGAQTPSSLTPDVVLATIKGRYLPGVERCYQRHLKQHADSSGRVIVSFTVDPSGRARDGSARGIAAQVEDCIASQIDRWQFPIPRSEVGAPIEASFALGLQLAAR